jgi:hypothetical protein
MESKIIKSSLLEKKDFVPLKAINAKTRLMEAGKRIGKGFSVSKDQAFSFIRLRYNNVCCNFFSNCTF